MGLPDIDSIIDQYANYCRDNNIDFEDIVDKASKHFKDEIKPYIFDDNDIRVLVEVEIDLLRSRILRKKLEKAYYKTRSRKA